jgi:hypothetical protein
MMVMMMMKMMKMMMMRHADVVVLVWPQDRTFTSIPTSTARNR